MKSSLKNIWLPTALKALQNLCVDRVLSVQHCRYGCTIYGKPTVCLPFEFVMILLCSHVIGFAYSALSHRAENQKSPVIFAALSC